MKKNSKKKGFTLIELIVVIAILGILAAIMIPRLSGMRASAQVKADAATASTLANFARVQETETGTAVTTATFDATKYGAWPTPKSGGTFVLAGGGATAYSVSWTSTLVPYNATQTATEGVNFTISTP